MIRMRITKREPLPKWARVVIPIAAIITTLILSAIPILLAGGHLWKSYYYLFYGALGTRFNLLETFVKASPLLLTGLAVAFAFRAKFWNIGAEGQLLAGALAATVLGVSLGGIPGVLVLPVIILGGFLAGGIWAAIPAILKTKLKVDDVVSTLLLNYVMIHIMGALLFGPLQQPGSHASSQLCDDPHHGGTPFWPSSAARLQLAQIIGDYRGCPVSDPSNQVTFSPGNPHRLIGRFGHMVYQ